MRKVGVLGTGAMGRVHGRHYLKIPDTELHFHERDAEKAAAYAERFGAISADSGEELIERVDVVDVCLPTHLHFEYAAMALRAGKPVFCEKPMCRTTRECADLVELSHKTGVPVMPAQVVRYFPEFRRARELVREGAVGVPAAIRTRRGGAYPRGSEDWFGKFPFSGGVVMDLMIHDFDWIRWTFGEVERVFAQSLTFSGIEELDYALATLTLESGALAHVEGTWADPGGFRVTFEISGCDGFIEHDSRLAAALRTTTAGGSVSESPLFPAEDPYYSEIRAFLDAVDAGTPPPVPPEDGWAAVALCEAAIESVRTGRAVKPAHL
ncbi:MAG: Gfo/Idh/MocA family oxidoreductase [Armatimonadetes bacterium]|nr:Gfo/Idh/MocA family oxidoreductase [Armatimonadota bacterium]